MIYRICCFDESVTEFYVGSTTGLDRRELAHKGACNNVGYRVYNTYVYKFIRAHGGRGNWYVELYEEYPCDSKKELELREKELDFRFTTWVRYVNTRTD